MRKPRITYIPSPVGSGLDWVCIQGSRLACGLSPADALAWFLRKYADELAAVAVEGMDAIKERNAA